jgi:poly(A) polymerase
MTAAETEAVLKALGQGGAELRFVGGCVRDAVLGRPIATSTSPRRSRPISSSND